MEDEKNDALAATVRRPEVIPPEERETEVGSWFWVANSRRRPAEEEEEDGEDEGDRWLGCVVRTGSNFVELRSVEDGRGSYWTRRVHVDDFDATCTPCPEAPEIIAREIAARRARVDELMGEVKALTGRLSVSGSLAESTESTALALRSEGALSMTDYKAALVRAKNETLPDLFKAIERTNKELGAWMGASLIPLRAKADQLRPVIEAIEGRIFNVELYAGLTEEVELIVDGSPADIGTRVHLFQRRCYMDEECLARYRAGGMEFKDLGAFDAWLVEPENRDRLLPFPRCVVAFQVRRQKKEREMVNLRDFIRIMNAEKLDKMTFLYIRNGERVYRLSTAIDFGATLFPDMDTIETSGRLYAKMFGGSVDRLVSEGEYEAVVAKAEENRRLYEAAPPEDRWRYRHFDDLDRYVLFSPESVYYDDIAKRVEEEIARHNRLVLVLQGLLDRSPVLHPHPPWQLWTPEGFEQALALVYDESRALTPGEAPDFEAYRARLNASLATGSITVGQEEAWEIREAERECRRRDNDYRERSDYRPTRFRPYGDPGPGTLARVARFAPRARTCSFEWFRPRRRDAWRERFGEPFETPIRCSLTVPENEVLNVDAYTPGDFRIFFDDPRTRADYLQWAPLLLEAEEYHAGNRKVGEPSRSSS